MALQHTHERAWLTDSDWTDLTTPNASPLSEFERNSRDTLWASLDDENSALDGTRQPEASVLIEPAPLRPPGRPDGAHIFDQVLDDALWWLRFYKASEEKIEEVRRDRIAGRLSDADLEELERVQSKVSCEIEAAPTLTLSDLPVGEPIATMPADELVAIEAAASPTGKSPLESTAAEEARLEKKREQARIRAERYRRNKGQRPRSELTKTKELQAEATLIGRSLRSVQRQRKILKQVNDPANLPPEWMSQTSNAQPDVAIP